MINKRSLTLALTSVLVISQQVSASSAVTKMPDELHAAVVAQNETTVKTLISENRDWLFTAKTRTFPKHCGIPPQTLPLLHIAATQSSPAIVDFLCNAGAALHTYDTLGHTALGAAVGVGEIENALILIKHFAKQGISVDLYNKDTVDMENGTAWRTPFIMAAHFGTIDVADALLEAGADITAVDPLGFTALMTAARDKQKKIVEWLLSKPACISTISQTNNAGLNAFDIASLSGADSLFTEVFTTAGATHTACYEEFRRPTLVVSYYTTK